MNRKYRIGLASAIIGLAATFVAVTIAYAAATSKSLSTVFAIQNFSQTSTTTVTVNYRIAKNEGGGPWPNVSTSSTNFQLGPGQAANIAQYFDATMNSGRGSATVSSDQPVGAIVNQLVRTPGVRATSGSYNAFTGGAASVYAPLVFKNLSTSAGLINSTLAIMNTGSSPTDFDIVYISGVTFLPVFTKSITNLAAGESYVADQSEETSLANGFYGSAVVNTTTGGGQVAVVGNQFVGTDSLLTYPGFRSTDGYTSWAVPLYLCRLANGFSSPITTQNVSGSTIAAGLISIAFNPSSGTPFTVTNPSPIPNNASFVFNPRIDLSCPAGSQGSARVTSTGGNVVVLVNQLQAGAAAALSYNGIRTDSTNKTALSPVTFSRLSNGFSTVITVQNLDVSASGTITITYVPNSACAGCISYQKVAPIPAGGSVVQNHRSAEGPSTHPLPAGWFGSAIITGDVPIAAVVNQLNLNDPLADGSLSFNAFSQP